MKCLKCSGMQMLRCEYTGGGVVLYEIERTEETNEQEIEK